MAKEYRVQLGKGFERRGFNMGMNNIRTMVDGQLLEDGDPFIDRFPKYVVEIGDGYASSTEKPKKQPKKKAPKKELLIEQPEQAAEVVVEEKKGLLSKAKDAISGKKDAADVEIEVVDEKEK